MGILAAACVAVAVWWWLGSRVAHRLTDLAPLEESRSQPDAESRVSEAEQRVRLLAQAPLVADLLSAAVHSGASIVDAISFVGEAVDEPARGRLLSVRAAIELGAPPHVAWSTLLDVPALEPIAVAALRSLQTGAPLAYVLDSAASDMRQVHRAEVTEAARSAGVRTVAPLALCFLPAYLLVGVVPIIAGFASSLFG